MLFFEAVKKWRKSPPTSHSSMHLGFGSARLGNGDRVGVSPQAFHESSL